MWPVTWNRCVLFLAVAACLFVSGVSAQLEKINQDNRQLCSGMYSKKDWSGSIQPYIVVNLNSWNKQKYDFKDSEKNEIPSDTPIDLSVVIFEYVDSDNIGVSTLPDQNSDADMNDFFTKYICDDIAIKNGFCTSDDFGKFIIKNTTETTLEILTFRITDFGSRNDTVYYLKNTGYYCVSTYSSQSVLYELDVNFRNSYGNLNASEIPKLPLYGGLTILYLVVFFYYFYNYYKYRNNVSNLQKNLNFFTIFLIVENILIWFYYELRNNFNPINVIIDSSDLNISHWKLSKAIFIKFYTVLISILDSARLTFSFYLLLLISLGMGIVYPNLDKKLLFKCKCFACVHFCFCILYVLTTYLTNPENPSLFLLLALVPLAISLTVFYYLILHALTNTTNYLKAQKQTIKLNIYKKLFMTLFISMVVLFIGLVLSSFVFIGMSTTELIEQHWKSRFLAMDFWPTWVYFCVYAVVLFIWRPTSTSYLLIISQQVNTDESEFELNNLGNEFTAGANDDDDDNDSFVGHFGPNDEETTFGGATKKNEEINLENVKKNDVSDVGTSSTENPFKVEDEDEEDDDADDLTNVKTAKIDDKEDPFSDKNKV